MSVTVTVPGGHADASRLDACTSAPAPGESATRTASLTPTAWGEHPVSLVLEDAIPGGVAGVPVTARVQEDADHDGRGRRGSGGEDGNDTDRTVTGPVAEHLPGGEGIDNDRNGCVDGFAVTHLASGIRYGTAASLGLGDHGGMDLDGDGR